MSYGDGVFETIKVIAGVPAFLPFHLARLERGCMRLAIPLELELLRIEIEQILAPAQFTLAVLKITITRGEGGRGYQFDSQLKPNRYLLLQSLVSDTYQRQQAGIHLRICEHRLPINPRLAGIKHLNRLDNVLARAEWSDTSIGEGLMLDTQGRLIEGTMTNVFLVVGTQLITPDLHRCGVEGIIRQVVLQTLADTLKLATSVRDITLDDLSLADEMFVCNSLLGICPVLSIGGLKKAPGQLTLTLQAALSELE